MCRRAFGSAVEVGSAVELGLGAYNSTYRLELIGLGPVILRVAPEPGRQYRIERELMRNEHATLPFLASLGPLLPRTLAIDFTHELLGRDYLFQTVVSGVPAPDGLNRYPRPEWAGFYRQLGSLTRLVHDVRGQRFGPIAGPAFDSWSQALIAYFTDAVADLGDAGLDGDDIAEVAVAAHRHRQVLDEITEPRLLHGDLWTVNVLLDPDAAEPSITGVVDSDRAIWGDPLADWPIRQAGQRPGTERDAFWDSYGQLPATPADQLRALFYRARHLSAIRLERHRLGSSNLKQTYAEGRELLVALSYP